MIGDLLDSIRLPEVDLLDELFPQSESAYPERKSRRDPAQARYVIRKLGRPSMYSIKW
jgi:hypothetical protein